MIDFEKLNENINAINEVLKDLDTETKAIRKNIDCKKSEVFGIMFNDIFKYFRLIKKAYNNNIPSFGITVLFDGGHQIRIANDWYCGTYCCCLKVREDLCDDWFPIYFSENRFEKGYDKSIFESLNRSPKSVQWLVDIVSMNWDEYKGRIENAVATHVNSIITERSKKAHKEYERMSNEAEKLGIEN
jgi:hypothetical protein